MSRRAAPPRLILRKDRGREVWVIKDFVGGKAVFKRTGCDADAFEAAQGKLGRYLAESHQAPRRQRRLDEITLTDVISIYAQDVVVHLATRVKAAGRLERLEAWWGDMKLDEVTGATCRQFAASRTPGAARRELQDLQAAINYHHREGYHRELVRVTLPKAGLPRERWLTRDEVAHLLRLCLHTKETQNGRATAKAPLRHLARFILFGVYTGSRTGDCLNAAFRLSPERGFVDTGSGLYHRKPIGKRATRKRQPTVPLDRRLLCHLKRWEGQGARHVVVYDGRPMGSIKTAWQRLAALAGMPDVIPYTMRHTAITWMKQKGVPSWEVAGYVGTSEAMIERVYGHHDPKHLQGAVKSMERKR